jgi:hypothetical protein
MLDQVGFEEVEGVLAEDAVARVADPEDVTDLRERPRDPRETKNYHGTVPLA